MFFLTNLLLRRHNKAARVLNSVRNKRAQVWGLDLVVASIIFLVGIILLYVYAINYYPQARGQLDELYYDGDLASQLILSEENFSIVSDGKINQTKLNNFYNINYDTKKSLLGVTNNFYFIVEGLEVEGNPVNYVGKINDTEIESLVGVTRLTIYKNKPIKFQIFIWR